MGAGVLGVYTFPIRRSWRWQRLGRPNTEMLSNLASQLLNTAILDDRNLKLNRLYFYKKVQSIFQPHHFLIILLYGITVCVLEVISIRCIWVTATLHHGHDRVCLPNFAFGNVTSVASTRHRSDHSTNTGKHCESGHSCPCAQAHLPRDSVAGHSPAPGCMGARGASTGKS